MKLDPKLRRILILLLVAGAVFAGERLGLLDDKAGAPTPAEKESSRGNGSSTATVASDGEKAVLDAFRDKRSKVWVELDAEVIRKLRDDLEGSRHQKFLIRLTDGHTVLVSHNIDLADRVPISEGDTVGIRGRYEWSEKGGVLHWTHHDPAGRKKGGWIRHSGRTYK